MVKVIYKCFSCGVSPLVWTWDVYKVLPAEWGLVENQKTACFIVPGNWGQLIKLAGKVF